MNDDGPRATQEPDWTGTPAHPRQAATVILMRGGSGPLELLLVQRSPQQRFMGGAWVFPGGAVDDHEGEGDAAHRAAAVRELAEEAQIVGVDPDALVKFSRWITPPERRMRFDTHFFLAHAPAGAEPRIDGSECVDLGWFTPKAALDAYALDRLHLVYPTIKHLQQLAPFPSANAVLDYARGKPILPVQPRIIGSGEQARVVLPGEPGYEPI